MPANLPPEYKEAEARFREAKDKEEKLEALQEMLSLLPNHKGTDKIEADIRRRISDLKDSSKKEKGPTRAKTPDQIEPEGAGQVVICGPPNSGKSSLLDILTNASPNVADFPFSTYGPTVGMMPYEDVQIQLIDTPPLSDEHVDTWVYNLIRKADLVLLALDWSKENPREDLDRSLENLGKENIFLFSPWENFDEQEIGRTNKKGILVATKMDECKGGSDGFSASSIDNIPAVGVSILYEDKLEEFKKKVFEGLGMIRIYTKKPGKDPDMDEPYLLEKGESALDAVRAIHRDLVDNLDYIKIWGSGRFDGQQVAQDHEMEDGDVIEIHMK